MDEAAPAVYRVRRQRVPIDGPDGEPVATHAWAVERNGALLYRSITQADACYYARRAARLRMVRGEAGFVLLLGPEGEIRARWGYGVDDDS